MPSKPDRVTDLAPAPGPVRQAGKKFVKQWNDLTNLKIRALSNKRTPRRLRALIDIDWAMELLLAKCCAKIGISVRDATDR